MISILLVGFLFYVGLGMLLCLLVLYLLYKLQRVIKNKDGLLGKTLPKIAMVIVVILIVCFILGNIMMDGDFDYIRR